MGGIGSQSLVKNIPSQITSNGHRTVSRKDLVMSYGSCFTLETVVQCEVKKIFYRRSKTHFRSIR